MRGAAYSVLTAFYQQLQGARFPEKFQVRHPSDSRSRSFVWDKKVFVRFDRFHSRLSLVVIFQVVYLLDTLRGSVEEPNQKLHCIISVFFVEAARLMLRPGNSLGSGSKQTASA